jgi:hypothetical protein
MSYGFDLVGWLGVVFCFLSVDACFSGGRGPIDCSPKVLVLARFGARSGPVWGRDFETKEDTKFGMSAQNNLISKSLHKLIFLDRPYLTEPCSISMKSWLMAWYIR